MNNRDYELYESTEHLIKQINLYIENSLDKKIRQHPNDPDVKKWMQKKAALKATIACLSGEMTQDELKGELKKYPHYDDGLRNSVSGFIYSAKNILARIEDTQKKYDELYKKVESHLRDLHEEHVKYRKSSYKELNSQLMHKTIVTENALACLQGKASLDDLQRAMASHELYDKGSYKPSSILDAKVYDEFIDHKFSTTAKLAKSVSDLVGSGKLANSRNYQKQAIKRRFSKDGNTMNLLTLFNRLPQEVFENLVFDNEQVPKKLASTCKYFYCFFSSKNPYQKMDFEISLLKDEYSKIIADDSSNLINQIPLQEIYRFYVCSKYVIFKINKICQIERNSFNILYQTYSNMLDTNFLFDKNSLFRLAVNLTDLSRFLVLNDNTSKEAYARFLNDPRYIVMIGNIALDHNLLFALRQRQGKRNVSSDKENEALFREISNTNNNDELAAYLCEHKINSKKTNIISVGIDCRIQYAEFKELEDCIGKFLAVTTNKKSNDRHKLLAIIAFVLDIMPITKLRDEDSRFECNFLNSSETMYMLLLNHLLIRNAFPPAILKMSIVGFINYTPEQLLPVVIQGMKDTLKLLREGTVHGIDTKKIMPESCPYLQSVRAIEEREVKRMRM